MAPPSSGNVSVEELGRRFDEFRGDFKDAVAGLHRRLDELQFVPVSVLDEYKRTVEVAMDAHDHRLGVVEKRVTEIDRTAATNRRMVVTAFIAPFIVGIAVAVIVASIVARS